MTTAEDVRTIWVQSDLMLDGTYATVVHYSDDVTRVLDRETAFRYAAAVRTAAARAEHDAAVAAQMTGMGVDVHAVAHVVAGLRQDRPPLDEEVLAPLRLEPGVSASRRVGFLGVFVGERQVGQWDPADARAHAGDVLHVLAGVDLDAAYHRYLVGVIGVDADRARDTITDLAAHLGVRRRRQPKPCTSPATCGHLYHCPACRTGMSDPADPEHGFFGICNYQGKGPAR